MSKPVSANMTRKTPIAPKLFSRLWGLRRLTASRWEPVTAILLSRLRTGRCEHGNIELTDDLLQCV